MKKSVITLAIFLAGTLLSACGGKAEPEGPWIGIPPGADLEAVTNRTEYYDLNLESEELFDLGLWEKNPEGEYYGGDLYSRGIVLYKPIGTQFLEGEPVQLWAEVSAGGVDICLYRTDNSREVLLEGVSDTDSSFFYGEYTGYVTQDKSCYFYKDDSVWIDGTYKRVGVVMKVLPTGEIAYRNTLEPGHMIGGMRQTEDGRIYLLLQDYDNYKETLGEWDPDAGLLAEEPRMEWDFRASSDLGEDRGHPGRAGRDGIFSLDLETQSTTPLLYADGTSYGQTWERVARDFRVMEDGSFEFLYTDRDGLNCTLERMCMEKVEKEPVVLRGFFEENCWIAEQVRLFNQKSDDYHVVLESCGVGNDPEDYARLTSVQVGAGKGPDILCGSELLEDYIGGMLEKGALEALNPYMEASGIQEEDYFPLVFSIWRKGEDIYGVTPYQWVVYEEMDAELLGGAELSDMEAFLDALLAREESAVYRRGLASGDVLYTFLRGSESLLGMVDWQEGSCAFDSPLFGKLLEAAGRYGDDGRRELEPELVEEINLWHFFRFNSLQEQEEKGRVSVGTWFDDGYYPASLPWWFSMAVNANSANKQGAWEFLAFLLGEEVQGKLETFEPPVRLASFDRWLEWQLQELCEVRYENGHTYHPAYFGENTSEEKRAAYRQAIMDARSLPVGTAPILDIILEEAEDYFNGSKSVEEVSKVVNNRVQLYLDERK